MNQHIKIIALLLLMAIALGGCAGAAGETSPTKTPAPAPVRTPTPTATAEVDVEDDEVQDDAEDDVVYDPEEEIEFADEEDSAAVAEALGMLKNMRHILLLGIDARPGEKTGRTDTMIIVSLDTEKNTIKLTSLMRDLYVEIPGRKNNRLNAAYVFGGPELLMKTIEQNFDLKIENYVAVNFSMLAELIDAVGGLELTVESNYYMDRINAVIRQDNIVLGISQKDGYLTKSGTQVMTGKQAQAYARYRYGTKDGDFGRTARQREVLTKLFDKLSAKSMLELAAIAAANIDKVYTNLPLEDILALAPALSAMRQAEISELRVPMDGAYESKTVSGMSVLVPNRTKVKQKLAEFLAD